MKSYTRTFYKTIFASILLLTSQLAFAQSMPDKVTTYQDEQGWKLLVNGKDFFIKGVVWGYSPRDENFTFNLWGLPEQDIRNVLDHDFSLMQQAGVNAIRSFSMIPPKWVQYINDQYSIKTVINPLMGRYGATVGGRFIETPDYSDPLTRQTLKQQALDAIRTYKDVPGVIMFALGNESNYGLSWSSFEIENLPEGEQQSARAEHLYSLFAETLAEGQKLTRTPITLVNGDIQYLSIISKYKTTLPMLGVNAYRGETFTSLWKDVKRQLDRPVVFFEFGSDVYNAKDYREDMMAQAQYLKKQWQDIYVNAYGHGYGNAIGGFVFEWRDEWWKYKQTEKLADHDNNASWENGGYKFDHIAGENNMNEEWFGVMRLGQVNDQGVFVAEPRIAYDLLAEVWKIDPLTSETSMIRNQIDAIDMPALQQRAQQRDEENNWGQENQAFYLESAEVTLDALHKGYDTFNPTEDEERKTITEFGQSALLKFRFNHQKLSGNFNINAIGNATDSDFKFKYGDRIIDDDKSHIEVYDFTASYSDKHFDLNAFYHVPRYHWKKKGDFFGLVYEVTDMEGQDIWNSKAPFGIEYVGKHATDGLTILAGPEIYWGANPKAVVKYQFGDKKQYAVMHSEEFEQREDGSDSSGNVAKPKNRQSSIYAKLAFSPRTQFEIGGLISGTDKINQLYDFVDNGVIKTNEVKLQDTLAVKGKLSFPVSDFATGYAKLGYFGLVADGGEPLRELGSELPYSEAGNQRNFEAGVQINRGHYTLFPRILIRDNLISANPLVNPTTIGTTLYPGVVPRNTDHDPFAVTGNRAAKAFEVILTFDPTPETPFYDWDNNLRENADFAYNLVLAVVDFEANTDAHLYYDKDNERTAVFEGEGFEPHRIWLTKSKLVFNPNALIKAALHLEAGRQIATGLPAAPIHYQKITAEITHNRQNIYRFELAKDKWGPYDFQREHNVTYPQQLEMEYVRLFNRGLKEKESSRFGLKLLYRTLDQGAEQEWKNTSGQTTLINDHMYEIQTYYTHRF